jgi:rsbT co-antagonist protein RsbR
LPERYLHELVFSIFVAPILALILASPAWVIGSSATILVVLLFRAGFQGVYAQPATIVAYFIVIGGMILARLVTETALRAAEEHARQAQAEKARAEAQAHELVDANELMTVQLDQQRQLLDLIASLETPAVPLAEGVLFAPIVGHLDTRRTQALTARLLQDASEQRARMVILDITGVSMMDTAVAKALLNTARSLRLLGCDVTISGISSAVALTLVHLGINLDEVRTARSPQEALANYLGRPALRVVNGAAARIA